VAGTAEPVAVRLAHASPGRVRLRLARALDRDAMEALADRLAGCAGVSRVALRPSTGSVILEGAGGGEEILGRLVDAGAVRRLPPRKPQSVSRTAELGLVGLDMEIRKRTEGALDFRASMALLLFAAALVQLARGQVAGPFSTLAISALAFVDPTRK
jgi:hypothetical protein